LRAIYRVSRVQIDKLARRRGSPRLALVEVRPVHILCCRLIALLTAPAAENAGLGDWVEHFDQQRGKAYYSNSVTKETSWKRPTNPELGAVTEQVEL